MVKDREEEVMEAENEVWTQIKRISQSLSEVRKSSLGGISGASALVLAAQPWTRGESRVEFHSHLRRSRTPSSREGIWQLRRSPAHDPASYAGWPIVNG